MPGWSLDVGNFANDWDPLNPQNTAKVKLKGTIVAGILDVRGTADVHGTLLMTFRPVEGVARSTTAVCRTRSTPRSGTSALPTATGKASTPMMPRSRGSGRSPSATTRMPGSPTASRGRSPSSPIRRPIRKGVRYESRAGSFSV